MENVKNIANELRKLFIKRMTVDSDHNDRRRRDYNQAIFHIREKEEIDMWNAECKKFGLEKMKYGSTYSVFGEIDMDMVLTCFDDAVKDLLKNK